MRPACLLLFAALVQAAMTGCTGVRHETLVVFDHTAGRQELQYTENQLAMPSPERARLEVDQHFKSNQRNQFLRAMRYGNYLLVNWPDHRYAAMTANRCSWSALLSLRYVEAEMENLFDVWEENVLLLARAVFYADESAKRDQTGGHWAERARRLRVIARDGYTGGFNPLFKFFAARKLMMIDSTIERRRQVYEKALRILEDLQRMYPDWLPSVVKRNRLECEHQIEKYRANEELEALEGVEV